MIFFFPGSMSCGSGCVLLVEVVLGWTAHMLYGNRRPAIFCSITYGKEHVCDLQCDWKICYIFAILKNGYRPKNKFELWLNGRPMLNHGFCLANG